MFTAEWKKPRDQERGGMAKHHSAHTSAQNRQTQPQQNDPQATTQRDHLNHGQQAATVNKQPPKRGNIKIIKWNENEKYKFRKQIDFFNLFLDISSIFFINLVK